MVPEAAKGFTEYGVLGLFVIVLISVIMYLIKVHKQERDELRALHAKQFDTVVSVIEKNTIVVSELKGTMDTIQKSIC